MKQEQEPQGTRRQLLIAPALSLLRNLEPPQHQWRSDIHERFPFRERREAPEEGDVILVGNSYDLLLNGKRYVMSRDHFEAYRWRSKFDEYGGRVFSLAPNTLTQDLRSLPIGEAPKLFSPFNIIFDVFTGQPKDAKQFGGEINIFFSGFLTDEFVLFETPGAENALFRKVRGESGLASLGWGGGDTFLFTYGVNGIGIADAEDTAKDPRQTFEKAMEYVVWIKENFPFARINLMGHSLGAVIALEIAKRNYNSINNLVLASGPVRGLRRTIENRIATPIMKRWLKAQGIEEHVSDYLFDLWNDKFYQRGLDLFVERFTAMGKRIVEYASDKDRIVPIESTLLRKKVKLVKGKEIRPIWEWGPIWNWDSYVLDILTNHWVVLDDDGFVEDATLTIDENRAAA